MTNDSDGLDLYSLKDYLDATGDKVVMWCRAGEWHLRSHYHRAEWTADSFLTVVTALLLTPRVGEHAN